MIYFTTIWEEKEISVQKVNKIHQQNASCWKSTILLHHHLIITTPPLEQKNGKIRLFHLLHLVHLVLQFPIFGLLPVFGLRSFARSSLFWPDLRSHPLPITSRMTHTAKTHTVTLCKDFWKKRLFSQGHQPEDLPNPDRDEHVGQPEEPVRQKGFGLRIPRILEWHAGERLLYII